MPVAQLDRALDCGSKDCEFKSRQARHTREGSHSGQLHEFRQPKADPPRAEKLNMYYYVYVLQNKKGQLYKGSTADLRKRALNHNEGKVRSTKKGRPWKLIYYEAFSSKTAAKKEELFLKSGKGRERLKFLLNDDK